MNYVRKFLLFLLVVLVAAGIILIFVWLRAAGSMNLANLTTALTTTTEILGTLLAIITAGLMFTQGKFSELVSELNNKSPDYLAEVFPIEKIQAIGTHLLSLREKFNILTATTTVPKEKNLYESIVSKTSLMFVDYAVLLNLKLKQQGLPPTDLLISEMDANLYRTYQKKRQGIKKDWHLLILIKHIIDIWEGPGNLFVDKSDSQTALEADMRNSVAILKLKETVDKSSTGTSNEVMKTSAALDEEVSKIGNKLHEDRIPQLLSQMKQVNALRGTYFYLTMSFIAAPLLINLLILPQLSQTNVTFIQSIISLTSLLSVAGVIFMLMYVYKILNV